MNELRLHQLEMLHLLWLAPALIAVFVYAASRRKQALAKFAGTGALDRIGLSVRPGARLRKAILSTAAVALIIVALARPAWNPTERNVSRRGRDVVFVLDVSRSMLAEDLPPSRLDRAKLAILDAIESLEGDRVALVAFAGAAAVKCPLTLDYGFFRMALEDISPDSVARGGTLIGDALRKTLSEVFDDKPSQFRDVILITDGEDHESFPIEAAAALGERGARLIAIGLGDEDAGKRIPTTDEAGRTTFLTYDGREVWSKLDASSLRKMASSTPGGRYLNVATGAFDLGEIYQQLIASADRRDLEERTIERYEEKFQIFLGAGFLLLCFESLIRERKR